MSNQIILKGVIQNIRPSHDLNGIQYSKADLIVNNSNHKDSIIPLIFKSHSCKYNENETVALIGNVRSRNAGDNNKNKIEVFVFTYFDVPEEDFINNFIVEGTISKSNKLYFFPDRSTNLQFIFKNIIDTTNRNIVSYIPCICWNDLAKSLSSLVSDTPIRLKGELRSREYKKYLNENEFELRVAHEFLVTNYEVISNE